MDQCDGDNVYCLLFLSLFSEVKRDERSVHPRVESDMISESEISRSRWCALYGEVKMISDGLVCL